MNQPSVANKLWQCPNFAVHTLKLELYYLFITYSALDIMVVFKCSFDLLIAAVTLGVVCFIHSSKCLFCLFNIVLIKVTNACWAMMSIFAGGVI